MAGAPNANTLFYGDNLDILRQHVADESVDLIYLDPPFNSNATYNVLFKSPTGEQSAAQIEAFDDTWHWNFAAERAFDEVVQSGNSNAANMIIAMRSFLGENDMMAYLAMMAVRLIELHRVLKETGSLYLHCDPTASHYLKLLLDAVFAAENFISEIIWKRTSSQNNPRRWGPIHDVILFYSKTKSFKWNRTLRALDKNYVKAKYSNKDAGGSFQIDNLTASGTRGGMSGAPWRGFDPTSIGRHWGVPADTGMFASEEGKLNTHAKLDILDGLGLIAWPEGKDGTVGFPRFKRYLGVGQPIQDVIDDIPPINSQAQERLGYPTQKPLALLERILAASSNEGDVVLDPFCGCGTTVHVAQKLNRRWLGIDVTHLAIGLIQRRLTDAFPMVSYDVVGVPKDVGSATALALADKYEFQKWALSMVEAQPFKGGRKGADGGVDGYIYFKPDGKVTEKAIVSVKGGGHVSDTMIKDLITTVDHEKAKIGVFITLAAPTKPMIVRAATAGFYKPDGEFSKLSGSTYPKIQILTIADLFEGKRPDMPWIDASAFKKAKVEPGGKAQGALDL